VALNIYVIRGGGVEKDDLENWKKTLRIRSISDSDRSPERSTFPVWTAHYGAWAIWKWVFPCSETEIYAPKSGKYWFLMCRYNFYHAFMTFLE
jgi:hypothetical protein